MQGINSMSIGIVVVNMLKDIQQSGDGVGKNDVPEWLLLVRQHVSSLRFGTVQITVHDSRVTQIERVEKVRLDRPNPGLTR